MLLPLNITIVYLTDKLVNPSNLKIILFLFSHLKIPGPSHQNKISANIIMKDEMLMLIGIRQHTIPVPMTVTMFE